MHKPLLVVIDDRQDVRRFVARVAHRQGYEVVETDDPKLFRETVASRHPEVVAIDLIMPSRDGVELSRDLAELAYDGGVLLMSGYDSTLLRQAKDLSDAFGLKVLGAIRKPIEIEQLRALLPPVTGLTASA